MGACASSRSEFLERKFETLSNSIFYLHFGEADLREFSKYFSIEEFEPYDVICRQGSPVEKFYIVSLGTVVFNLDDGRERKGSNRSSIQLTSKNEGSFFGNVGIMEPDSKWHHAVTAQTHCELVSIDAEGIDIFIERHPRLTDTLRTVLGQDIEQSLKTLPLFSSADQSNLRLLASLLRFHRMNKDDVLFYEGEVQDEGNSLFIIYQGGCKAVTEDEAGVEQVLNTFKKGQFFGEIGLMIDMPRTATIKATENSLLLELAKADFQAFLHLANDKQLESNIQDLLRKRTAESFRKYKVPLFASIPDDKYALLGKLAEIETFGKEEIIFKEGDVGDKFYLIADGQCKVTATAVRKGVQQQIILSKIGPGNYFGENAFAENTTRNATIKTITRTIVVSLTQKNLKEFLSEVPEALALFEVRIGKLNVGLAAVLHTELGQKYFMKHLEKEYATENLRFWNAARKFQQKYASDYPGSQEAEKEEDDVADEDQFLAHEAKASEPSQVQPKHSFDELKEDVMNIYKTYIDEKADMQVNIQAKRRYAIEENIKKEALDACLFMEAKKEVYNLMTTDSFPRFKDTELFQSYLDEQDKLQQVSNADTQRHSSYQGRLKRSTSKRHSHKRKLSNKKLSLE